MSLMQLIPAIDIIDGQLVRLVQGDYNQKTVYAESPKQMAAYYQSIGLSHIHVVDLNGATDGTLVNLSVIESILEIPNITIQVGGGIRSIDHANALFDCGVSQIIIGSLLIDNFTEAANIINSYPNQVIAGLDIKDNHIATHGWKTIAPVTIAELFSQLDPLPIHSIITTDISRDGTFSGANAELYQSLAPKTGHNLIASGGVDSIDNIYLLKNLDIPNLSACVVGKAIIEEKISSKQIQEFLCH